MKRTFAAMSVFLLLVACGLCGCEKADVSENISKNEEQITEENMEQATDAMPEEKDGTLYINSEDNIEIDENIIAAPVDIDDIIDGKPIQYARHKADGWVFEWVRSDYRNLEKEFLTDESAVIISKENDKEFEPFTDKLEELTWSEQYAIGRDKLVYIDVNFDGLSDLLVKGTPQGNQGIVFYTCYLQTENGFERNESFSDIGNPCINTADKRIQASWRSNAVTHGWELYEYKNGEFVKLHTLVEEPASDENGEPIYDENGDIVWRYTVDDEEICRTNEITPEEKADLLDNDNSEWGLLSDKWEHLWGMYEE